MMMIVFVLLGVALPFVSGILLMKGKVALSLVSINAGAFCVIAAIGKATTAT